MLTVSGFPSSFGVFWWAFLANGIGSTDGYYVRPAFACLVHLSLWSEGLVQCAALRRSFYHALKVLRSGTFFAPWHSVSEIFDEKGKSVAFLPLH